MSPIENYHNNAEEDIALGRTKQGPKIYKNTPEIIPDPDTLSEMPGIDFEDWTEKNTRGNTEEAFDFAGEPIDAEEFEHAHKEVMQKYDSFGHSDKETEQVSEPAEASSDSSDSKKHESIKEASRNKIKDGYEWTQRENLKTISDSKKQRTFRERIRKFLDFN